MTKRVFLGLSLPEKIKKKIYKTARELRQLSFNVKWVERENLHVTFEFLGHLEEERIERLKDLRERVKKETIRVGLGQIKAFPSRNSPRVIYLEITQGKEELIRLHKEVRAWLINQGYELKRKSLHLTLGRFRKPPAKTAVKRFWQEAEKLDFSKTGWMVKEVSLFESKLSSAGPSYKIVQEFSLA